MGQLKAGAAAPLPRPGEACSAASVWRIASAHFPETLIAPEERHAVERALATLAPLSALIVERPLAAVAPQVDISLCATPADGGPRHWPGHPAWQAVRAFHRDWTGDAGLLQRAVGGIWLEFDRPQLVSALPVPCFFADTRQTAGRDLPDVVDAVLARFAAPALRGAARADIDRILGRLPPGGKLDFLGVMLAREPAAIRMCIALPVGTLLPVLASTGQAIDSRLQTVGQLASNHADQVVLHLNAGQAARQTIGVELKPRHADGWAGLLADLAQHGLCSAHEQDDLLATVRRSGISRHRGRLGDKAGFSLRPPARWADVESFVFESHINHIKLVWGEDRALAAKAYLRIGYKWQDRAACDPRQQASGARPDTATSGARPGTAAG